MTPALDTGPRKRSTPCGWLAHKGRLSTIGLEAAYHTGRILQWPFGAVFWLIDGELARLDAELERRKGEA